MELEKMSDKNLQKHIVLLQGALKATNDERNTALYIKWINQARVEQERRFNKRNVSKGKNYYV